MFAQTQENTLRHPKSAGLFVFYSREHFATIRNLQAYLCSTQENTLRLSEIDKSTCVLLRRTLYDYPISASLFVFSLRRTLYNYPISASLLVFYYSYFAFQLVRWFRGWCCFAANFFYCLWLPIQYNARRRWPKYYAWNIKSCGVDAASQQTYFIVSGSPSNTMLGGGDQNTRLGM